MGVEIRSIRSLYVRVSYNGNTSAFPACLGLSGIRIMVVRHPSKVETPVRFWYPAEAMAGRQADAGSSILPTRYRNFRNYPQHPLIGQGIIHTISIYFKELAFSGNLLHNFSNNFLRFPSEYPLNDTASKRITNLAFWSLFEKAFLCFRFGLA
ncbi:MAG: hypothetical protein UY73_C0030G0008 [Parcubacteria group bacterium GW2011_GWA2_52_8]|nr:MAG: hypothetical protein UY73_C0030G0008 [Parcubacteria group bacterium GW2011_GWA2_52_8]